MTDCLLPSGEYSIPPLSMWYFFRVYGRWQGNDNKENNAEADRSSPWSKAEARLGTEALFKVLVIDIRACDRLIIDSPLAQPENFPRYKRICAPGNTGDLIYLGKSSSDQKAIKTPFFPLLFIFLFFLLHPHLQLLPQF